MTRDARPSGRRGALLGTLLLRAVRRRTAGYRQVMSDTQPQHPQDPAEGQDFDEKDIESSDESQNESNGGAQQNQPRELNDDDDALQPGGNEPTD